MLPVYQALISSMAQARKGQEWGWLKGCPSLQLQAVPAVGWCPSPRLGQLKLLNHWDLAVALSTRLVWGCRSSLYNLARPALDLKPLPVPHWAMGTLQGDLAAQCHFSST